MEACLLLNWLPTRMCVFCINMCQSRWENRTILKYADASAIFSQLQDNQTSHRVVKWWEESHLQLNVSKTKDLKIDRKHAHTQEVIKHQTVECVQTYKYLGTIIDSKLNFEANCEAVCRNWHQRLFCLRKLCYFHTDKTMMTLFYPAFIESIWPFSIVSWFGNLSLKSRNSESNW